MVWRMSEKSSSEELSLSIEMPALAISRSTGWASSKRGQPGGERSRSTTSIVSGDRPWRPWRGRPRRRPRGAPASRPVSASATPGAGIVERQRLADAARGAGDDDAREVLSWDNSSGASPRSGGQWSGVGLIASMTGYARAQGADDRRRWVWEARSVNGRNLEVRCRVPQGFDRLENPARTAAGGQAEARQRRALAHHHQRAPVQAAAHQPRAAGRARASWSRRCARAPARRRRPPTACCACAA